MMQKSLDKIFGNTAESESTNKDFRSVWNISDSVVGIFSEKGSVSKLLRNDPIESFSRSQHRSFLKNRNKKG